MGSYRVCVCFTRTFEEMVADPPPDVAGVFHKHTDGGTHMTPEQLRRFLVDVQGDAGATVSKAETMVEQILQRRRRSNTKYNGVGPSLITLDDFHHLLFSVDLNPPIKSQVHQDMSAPMSHYFVYTGHNSYLTGNQLNSKCSDAPIVKALKRGVRVIELDLWPNSNSKRNPVHVLHGRTLTAPVKLLRCLKAIKEHAFSASPYPVVITLEDHLNSDLQAKVAEMVTETFGDMLYCPDLEHMSELPSPEELKYRVIISTKPPKEYLKAKSCDENRNNLSKKQDDARGGGLSGLASDLSTDEKSEGDSTDEDDTNMNPSPAYKSLIAIHAGKPKGGLKQALKVEADKVRRLSLSEQALEKAANSHGMDVVRFTQKNVLRIYPKGTRFTSSNYKPLLSWMHGAQMVAFNMQGYGKNLWLMQGMFRGNGGCGYVKKPDFLLTTGSDNQVFNPNAELPVKKTLKVKVYMGDGWKLDFKQTHFDSYSPPDFYTKVCIAGVPADTNKMKTRVQYDNWSPVWNEEFVFPLTAPELALLRIEVREHDLHDKDDFGGQTCLPVSEISQGIRAVPLCNRKGVEFNSVKLLMSFEFI